MRLFRPRYALSLAVSVLALLAGGGLDWALEWMHNRVLSSSSSAAIGERNATVGGEPQPPRLVDAVVVLGYALERDGTLSPALEHRVRSAVREWERAVKGDRARGKRRRTKLIFSGGHPGGGVRRRSEAAVMGDLALRLLSYEQIGEDEKEERDRDLSSDWLLEEGSTSTWENAVESTGILSSLLLENEEGGEEEEKKGRQEARGKGKGLIAFSVSVATSPFHQRRALATFRCAASGRQRRKKKGGGGGGAAAKKGSRALFSFFAAASPRPPPASALERFERAFEAAREVAALGWYWARGRLCVA